MLNFSIECYNRSPTPARHDRCAPSTSVSEVVSEFVKTAMSSPNDRLELLNDDLEGTPVHLVARAYKFPQYEEKIEIYIYWDAVEAATRRAARRSAR